MAVISSLAGMSLKTGPQGRDIFQQQQIFGKRPILPVTLWYDNFDFVLVALNAC